jgi:hypothetical protein
VNVGDLHHEAGFFVGVDTLFRQLAGDFDRELESELTEIAAILVALHYRTRWCWRWFRLLGSRVPRQRPYEAGRAQHHAAQASDCPPPTID